MTLGTVVVEANLTSGALITARMANDNGRQVFAVPGRIDSPRSKGCHELIKNGGAKLCESAEDILSEFEYLFPSTNRPEVLQDAPDLPPSPFRPTKQRSSLLLTTRKNHRRPHPAQRLAGLGRVGHAAGIGDETADPAVAGQTFHQESVALLSGQ